MLTQVLLITIMFFLVPYSEFITAIENNNRQRQFIETNLDEREPNISINNEINWPLDSHNSISTISKIGMLIISKRNVSRVVLTYHVGLGFFSVLKLHNVISSMMKLDRWILEMS